MAHPEAAHLFLSARLTMVEFYSAVLRRRREGTVSAADCEIVIRAFSSHSATDYDFVELTLSVIDRARELLEHHPLRANDAVQLASALIANRDLIENELPELLFVSADDRLNAAATAEGLPVENPVHYS